MMTDYDILFAHLQKREKITTNGSESKYIYTHYRCHNKITFSRRQPKQKLYNLKLKVVDILLEKISNSIAVWLKQLQQQMNHDEKKTYNLIETAIYL